MSIVARDGPVFACHNGWHAGNHTGRPTCYRVTDEKAPSLALPPLPAEASAGLEIDGGSDSGGRLTTQAAPVCIETEEENAFLTSLVRGFTWTGLYQNGSTGTEDAGYDDGWGRCVTGDAPNTSAWAVHDSTRANFYGPEDRMVLGPGRPVARHDVQRRGHAATLVPVPVRVAERRERGLRGRHRPARGELAGVGGRAAAAARRALLARAGADPADPVRAVQAVPHRRARVGAAGARQDGRRQGRARPPRGGAEIGGSVRLRVTFFLLTVGFFAVSVGFGVTVSNSTLPWSSPRRPSSGRRVCGRRRSSPG